MNSDDRILAVVATCVFAVGGAVATWLVVAGGGFAPRAETAVPVVSAERSQATEVLPLEPVQPAGFTRVESDLSDEAIRAVVAGISKHPRIVRWLATDRLIERFVEAVEDISEGRSPRRACEVLAPEGDFVVHDYKLDFAIAQGTYRRFDLVTEVFVSLDADASAVVLDDVRTKVDREFARASWGDSGFDGVVKAAFSHLLEVRVPNGPIEVERWATAYVFADDQLEALSDAQRQLLRMGPVNARKVQAKLVELARSFGWGDLGQPPVMRAVDEAPVDGPPEIVLIASIDDGGEPAGSATLAPPGAETAGSVEVTAPESNSPYPKEY